MITPDLQRRKQRAGEVTQPAPEAPQAVRRQDKEEHGGRGHEMAAQAGSLPGRLA